MSRSYVTIQEWLEEAVFDPNSEKKATRVASMYNRPPPLNGTKEAFSTEMKGKTWNATELAKVIKGKSETFVQDTPGIHTFTIEVFYESSQEAGASHNFTIIDGELKSGGSARTITEHPDAKGIVAQAMRLGEHFANMAATMIQHQSVSMMQRESRWYDREHELQTEVRDSYGIINDMLMKQSQAQHDLRMKELEFSRATLREGQIMKYLPAMANGLSGRELIPQSTVDTTIIEGLYEHVTPDKLQKLVELGVIPEDAVAPIVLRFNQIKEAKEREAQAIREMAPASNDPREDAMGDVSNVTNIEVAKVRRCASCATANDQDASFCKQCGNPLKKAAAQ